MPLFRPYRPSEPPADTQERTVQRAVRKSSPQDAAASGATDIDQAVIDEPDADAVELVDIAESPIARSREKNRPTRTRKEAEAERRAKARPNLSKKDARRLTAERRRAERTSALDARDNTPEKQLLRDFFDSRWNFLEFLLPALLVLIAGSMLGGTIPAIQTASIFVMWGFLAVSVLDFFLAWRRFKALLALRIPGASTRGLLFYGVNRAMQIRKLRTPRPQVKRGEKF